MMKNTLILTVILGAAAWAGTLACSSSVNTPPAPPPDCARGTHQEGDKCVLNGPSPAPAPAPAAAPAAK
jgi:hypothetical protein